MVDVARRTAHFFAHESCGHCTPCRVGSQRILQILQRIEAGRAGIDDVDRLYSLCEGIAGNTFCPMGDAQVMPLRSLLDRFGDEFRAHIDLGKCPVAA